MKALQKDRSQRYQTATDFARDIQHYLAHEPVHAGPPGSWYRIRKYARRFRLPLSIAAGFVALLVVITVLAVRGYYREAKLRSDTETARGEAEIARQPSRKRSREGEEQFQNGPRCGEKVLHSGCQ